MIKSKYIHRDSNTIDTSDLTNLKIKVDNQTIETSTQGIRVKSQSIKTQHLDLGLNSGQINASVIPVDNSNNYFSSNNIQSAVDDIASKLFIYKYTSSSFTNLQPVSSNNQSSSTVLDSIIKSIPNHNNGQGSRTQVGVITNNTIPYKIPIVNTTTKMPIYDVLSNIVYARLTFSSGQYIVTYYSVVNNTETPYNGFLTTHRIDFLNILFCQKFMLISMNNYSIEDPFYIPKQ